MGQGGRMDSEELSKMGFSEWHPFNREAKKGLLCAAPKSVGVYAIRRDTPFSRALGASDILYIGSAANQKGMYGRIGQYLSPVQPNGRISGFWLS
jgi:hypothetical protein